MRTRTRIEIDGKEIDEEIDEDNGIQARKR